MTTGMPDFGELLAQAQQMQQQMMDAQESLGDVRAVGTSGGGLVSATVDGRGDLVSLAIDPAAYDADEPDALDTLADLVVAAVRDAKSEAERVAAERLASASGGLAALGGSLGDLFGGTMGEPAGGQDAGQSAELPEER
jgi:nucleoid-associated protein EbfC